MRLNPAILPTGIDLQKDPCSGQAFTPATSARTHLILARLCNHFAGAVTAVSSGSEESAVVSDAGCLRRLADRVRPTTQERDGTASQLAGYRNPIPTSSSTRQQNHLSVVTDTDELGSDKGLSQQQGFEREPRAYRSSHRTNTDSLGRRHPQKPARDRTTPVGTGTGTSHRNGPGHDADRADQLGRSPGFLDWGAYEAAIRRWELTLDRPAPHPTEPGRTGRPRLSPLLVE